MTLERAHQLFRQGDFAAAKKLLARLVKSGQQVAAAHRMTGLIEGETRQFAAAVDSFTTSLRYDARSAESWYYLGVAHQKLDQHESAVRAFRDVLALAPDAFEAAHNLGLSLIACGRHAEALDALEQALRLNPKSFEAHLNRGVALGKLRRYEAEIESYDRALALHPGHLVALENRGIALMQAGQFDRAVGHYEAMRAQHPGFEPAKGALFFAKANAADWRDFDAVVQSVRDAIDAGQDCIDPFALLALPAPARTQLAAAARYTRQHFPPGAEPLWQAPRADGDRLRLAYLSADFATHAVAFLLVEVLERHDRHRFETIAISTGFDDASPMRRRLEAAFDTFVDASRMADAAIAERIAELDVDILVDLGGYTREARPGVMALRPAPVQIGYLGYPGTTGAPFIDYLVADAFVVPDDQRASYSEKIISLAGAFQPNDATRQVEAGRTRRADVGLPEDAFVFCNFNNGYKLTPAFFDIWMRLLLAVDGSVLWLLGRSPAFEARLRAEATSRGVAPSRLVFASHVEHMAHLQRLPLADLCLDNLPYNAHTTASDALWVGLPLVTCAGDTFAGRVAGSLLRTAGLPELVTHTLADYERLALDLACDRDRLAGIRRRLQTSGKSSALFDSGAYARRLEAGYAAAWERHVAGEPPGHIDVPA